MLKFTEWLKENKEDQIRLYRGLTQQFDDKYNLHKTDAPTGYSTWTDNPELAKQYAGGGGFIYYIDLPRSKLGNEIIDDEGERSLFFLNNKPAGLNQIRGNEYLIYTHHDLYDPSQIKLWSSNVEI